MGTAAQVHGWKLDMTVSTLQGIQKADSHGGHREPGDGDGRPPQDSRPGDSVEPGGCSPWGRMSQTRLADQHMKLTSRYRSTSPQF